MKTTKTRSARRGSPPPAIETETLQQIVNRRLALRFGLSLPLAAVAATLAGLGPDGRRA